METSCNINHELNIMRRSISKMRKGLENYEGYISLLEAVWDSIPALMFIKDKENNIVRVNNYFCEVLNVDKKDIEGLNVDDLMDDTIQSKKYAQNDLIVMKSGKAKTNIIEKLFDTNITLRTDKFPIIINKEVIGVLGFSIIIEN